jgi:hypothetical protein
MSVRPVGAHGRLKHRTLEQTRRSISMSPSSGMTTPSCTIANVSSAPRSSRKAIRDFLSRAMCWRGKVQFSL